jgi:hypothetical protein
MNELQYAPQAYSNVVFIKGAIITDVRTLCILR